MKHSRGTEYQPNKSSPQGIADVDVKRARHVVGESKLVFSGDIYTRALMNELDRSQSEGVEKARVREQTHKVI
jgi:hypothetical protein